MSTSRDHILGLEYRDVVLRPEQLWAFDLSASEVITVLEGIKALAEPVKVVVRHRPLSTGSERWYRVERLDKADEYQL